MGLVQREIERSGIPTVGVSIVRSYSEQVRPPRTVFLRWPYGHPFGEPGNAAQQRTVVREALAALAGITVPGTIVDLPYRWRRETYPEAGASDTAMEQTRESPRRRGPGP